MRELLGRRWITINEAANYLSLHPKSVYSLASRKIIPSVKIGRSVRIDLKALEASLEGQVKGGKA